MITPITRRAPFRLGAGFTLVEMLVAMTITLLMMAAIAKGFAFVGERVKDGRANLQMSAELTDITTRLRDEVSRCTVALTPNIGKPDQAGYFVYYEGPVTDATSSIFGTVKDPDGPTRLNPTGILAAHTRYGDFDDYLAFTAVAPPGTWFTGKVPRYVLDRRAAQVNGTTYTPGSNPYEPVTIRSRYAEIVYFVGTEYDEGKQPRRNPKYLDVDGEAGRDAVPGAGEDGFPDRLSLHRRVLLIRPDLNLEDSTNGDHLPTGIPQMSGDERFLVPDQWSTANTTELTTAAQGQANLEDDAWLYGMSRVHQRCDLSVRRLLDANGRPSGLIAANSLEDLSVPHNRFAHVRLPLGTDFTSMPLLALGNPPTILDAPLYKGARMRWRRRKIVRRQL